MRFEAEDFVGSAGYVSPIDLELELLRSELSPDTLDTFEGVTIKHSSDPDRPVESVEIGLRPCSEADQQTIALVVAAHRGAPSAAAEAQARGKWTASTRTPAVIQSGVGSDLPVLSVGPLLVPGEAPVFHRVEWELVCTLKDETPPAGALSCSLLVVNVRSELKTRLVQTQRRWRGGLDPEPWVGVTGTRLLPPMPAHIVLAARASHGMVSCHHASLAVERI